jgi:S-adenosylmethionine-diacylglycerol 3-amino-3-carboxypropyl transferase
MSTTLPSWVEATASLPIAFAQVREDALQDRWVTEQVTGGAEVLMVASGGCTAAYLAGVPTVRRLHLVDPNPAQLALARLKLRLLATSLSERLAVLGHAPIPADQRRRRLNLELDALGLPENSLGPPEFVAGVGPDHAGRYERLFVHLRQALGEQAASLDAVLQMRDPAEQSKAVAPETPLGRALDEGFDQVMSLENLVRLFGEGATRNRVEPFARHFARRTRHVLATFHAADNPYLWQMWCGRYPADALTPWLHLPPTSPLPPITWVNAFMDQALRAVPGDFDVVHLSNILDWLSHEEARTTLELAWAALRPGGWVIIRQLNSTLDIPGLGERFRWQPEAAAPLHAGDRSFFYRALHLGRKP